METKEYWETDERAPKFSHDSGGRIKGIWFYHSPRGFCQLGAQELPLASTIMSSLQKNGVEFIDKVPRRSPAGLFAAFRDPFGNVHELIQPQK